MIIEQAFNSLPEILTGYGFPSQEYEGGIVGAFSMALLQELNGRNVNNPISLMQLEKPFRDRNRPWVVPGAPRRYLRCDLHLDAHRIRIGSKALSAYGFRHSNWLEAKFFRAFDKRGRPKRSSNQVVNTGSLLADVVRLLTLVPRTPPGSQSFFGRYLLHVYLRRVEDHLSVSRGPAGARTVRPWIDALINPGTATLAPFLLSSETATVRQHLGGSALGLLSIAFTTTNFVLEPLLTLPNQRQFKMILSRFDRFTVALATHEWTLNADRTETTSTADAPDEIAKHVGQHIGLITESEQTPPEPEEGAEVEVGTE